MFGAKQIMRVKLQILYLGMDIVNVPFAMKVLR